MNFTESNIIDMGKGKCDVGGSLLRCKFNFPDGTYPLSVIAMVTDKDQKIMTPVSAETIELMHNEPLIDVR